jgi:hypothetical protein
VVALGRAIRATHPELQTLEGAYGCFNPRRIAGSSSWSLHAEGRALDVGVKGPAKSRAWALARELSAERTTFGIMRIMWDHHIWTTEREDKWHLLRVQTNQHTDHMHIELFWHAALRPESFEAAYTTALRNACG